MPMELYGVPGISGGSHQLQIGVAGRIVVRIGDRPVGDVGGGRPEPRPIGPPAELVDARAVARVLGRRVDVRQPQVALAAPAWPRPRSCRTRRAAPSLGTKVLSWMTSGMPMRQAGDERRWAISSVLGVIVDQVGRGLAGVDVQAGDAPGVVVVEQQPGALLVGVVVGLCALARIVRRARHVAGRAGPGKPCSRTPSNHMSGTYSTLTPLFSTAFSIVRGGSRRSASG